MRVGMVGAGGIASTHLHHLNLNEQVELVAVCDINEDVLSAKATEYGAAPYRDVEKMLDKEKLDVLFVCVPPFAHGTIEEEAAARGIHLFVEKPVGLDMNTVEQKAKAIEASGVLAGTGYCLRYLDTVQRLKEYIIDKTVAMVRGYYLTMFVSTPWWRDMSKSGGQLVEQATHIVDLMRYFAGDVGKVSADMALCAMHDVEGLNIPDVGSVNVVFTSGAIGHMATSFTQPDHRSGVEILGRDFRAVIDGTTLSIAEGDCTTTYRSSVDFYKEQDDAFIEAVKTGNPSLILAPFKEAVKTLQITLAANESAKSGSSVWLR